MVLKWWHKALAKDVVIGKDEDYLLRKYAKFGPRRKLSRAHLRKVMADEAFNAYCTEVDEEVKKEVAKQKMRLNMLANRAIDVIEEELESVPWNPETGEGDKHFDKKTKVTTAKDLIKISDVGQDKPDKSGGDVIINIITDDAEVEVEQEDK